MSDSPISIYKCYAHLPLVRMQVNAVLPLGQGIIKTMDFESWRRIDGGFSDARRHFESTRPVFYCEELAADRELIQAMKARQSKEPFYTQLVKPFRRSVTKVYQALLLTTGCRIPEPELSAFYYDNFRLGNIFRTFGPFEREAIVYGGELVQAEVTGEQVTKLIAMHSMLCNVESTLTIPEIHNALRTLARTARPEFTLLNDFVQCVAALEALLMSEVMVDLTKTFARRAAVLLNSDRTRLSKAFELTKRFYEVRSKALHGSEYRTAIKESGYEEGVFLFLGRNSLSLAVQRTIDYLRMKGDGGNGLVEMRVKLDAGYDNDKQFSSLHAQWDRRL